MDANVGKHPSELVLVFGRDRDARHLLAVAKGVVIDADSVFGWKHEVVGETLGIPGQLLERLL
jgi:hypothetical protein